MKTKILLKLYYNDIFYNNNEAKRKGRMAHLELEMAASYKCLKWL